LFLFLLCACATVVALEKLFELVDHGPSVCLLNGSNASKLRIPALPPRPSESIAIYCVRELVSCVTHLQSCAKIDIDADGDFCAGLKFLPTQKSTRRVCFVNQKCRMAVAIGVR